MLREDRRGELAETGMEGDGISGAPEEALDPLAPPESSTGVGAVADAEESCGNKGRGRFRTRGGGEDGGVM